MDVFVNACCERCGAPTGRTNKVALAAAGWQRLVSDSFTKLDWYCPSCTRAVEEAVCDQDAANRERLDAERERYDMETVERMKALVAEMKVRHWITSFACEVYDHMLEALGEKIANGFRSGMPEQDMVQPEGHPQAGQLK